MNLYLRHKNVDQWLDVYRELDELLDLGALIHHFGPEIVFLIVNQTLAGETSEGGKFASYSDRYARLKGRRQANLAGTATSRGVGPTTMLNLVRFRSTGARSGVVEVQPGRSSPDRAAVGEAHHKGLGNNPKRPWLGLNPRSLQALNDDTVDWLEDQVRRIAGMSPAANVRGRAIIRRGAGWRVVGST